MREFIIGNSLSIVRKNYPEYSNEKIEEIEYGLVSIYLLISKFIIISAIALLLGIFKELIIFSIFYNIIRLPSFGLHATKSWICLLSSSIIFIGVPFLCTIITIPMNLILLGGIICILLIYKNSPADTEKRPIINLKRRKFYKIMSTIVATTMVICAIVINNSFICNSLILALIIQCFVIDPSTYKLFGLPYDNYKNYL